MKYVKNYVVYYVVMSGPARALGIEMLKTPLKWRSRLMSGPARALGIEISDDQLEQVRPTGRGLRGPWGLK